MSSPPSTPAVSPPVAAEMVEDFGLAAALEQVSAQRMLACVEHLADEAYAGRRVGTPGGRAAASWLAEQLAGLGAQVRLDAFDVAEVRELYRTPALSWSTDTTVRQLEHRRDFVEHLARASTSTATCRSGRTPRTRRWRGTRKVGRGCC
ncbi:hypothetical protein OG884_35920 [Streptosporangium sp. NBC_01755]|uniref:hypothetical protein n=1 Tax=unclassified Streptosporangium TaxID=2632669 RepID=UPI002DD86C23|nr:MULTISPECIES: hypothetical protein [unclassified Streptosporangium]WSA28409.1 hypothetical protein OIE13_11340 [Streptosporangium sp. NBC_01810]WSD00101.1 hypothetical protein OG884_35920 [Streptosporangium sp. NBC_01755]